MPPAPMARIAGIQIGEMSRRTGCNIETIRPDYERITCCHTGRSAPEVIAFKKTASAATGLQERRELGFTLD